MLITPDFVFVHLPKTGGTFICKMLMQVYGKDAVEYGRKHATCDEIPESERSKPILSVFRSPFDRYVSQYHYGWWKTHPEEYCNEDTIVRDYPSYPNVSFHEFVYIANIFFTNAYRGEKNGYVNKNLPYDKKMGWHTEQFMRFFCRNSRLAFANINEENLANGSIPEYDYDVHFLHTHNLNNDLISYLKKFGNNDATLEKIRLHKPILPKDAFESRSSYRTENYFDKRLEEFILAKEQLLFNRFPQYINIR